MISDGLTAAFRGVCWAVCLSWVAYFAHSIGWRALPIMALPLVCAYHVGWSAGFVCSEEQNEPLRRKVREILGEGEETKR